MRASNRMSDRLAKCFVLFAVIGVVVLFASDPFAAASPGLTDECCGGTCNDCCGCQSLGHGYYVQESLSTYQCCIQAPADYFICYPESFTCFSMVNGPVYSATSGGSCSSTCSNIVGSMNYTQTAAQCTGNSCD
jgi:hypothetical protein